MTTHYNKIDFQDIQKLLYQRFGGEFLGLKDLPQPSLFKDMDKATSRVVEAIKNREKITIIGDYDVDGVTSTTLMKLFFEEIEYPIEWIIPNRFRDGYGLSLNIISQIKGTDLAITVDNGISAYQASLLCQNEGIELIITDHHLLPPQLPIAYAIIDQKQPDCSFPYDEVCGAQIAWYLIASIKNALGIQINMLEYMELVAIAIIADMMPLTQINRAMVIAGIEAINRSNRPALRAYKEHSNKEEINAEDIGFFLAPILNSAGRMEDASFAVDFLSATNIYDARVRLERLIEFNTQRKLTEQNITDEAIKSVDKKDNIIIVYGEDWHEGVVGIVSARVARHFEKPCIVMSLNQDNILKGSGRSFGECNLFAIVNDSRELLEKFGGHHSAIGLSMHKDNLPEFQNALELSYNKANYPKETIDKEILGEIEFHTITFELTRLISTYEPYGQGNHTPKFISHKIEIIQAETMGKNSEHLRFAFAQNGIIMQGVKFKTKERFNIGQKVSITYTVNENHFRGNVTLQLMIEKIVLS